jgi:hypothetical protein
MQQRDGHALGRTGSGVGRRVCSVTGTRTDGPLPQLCESFFLFSFIGLMIRFAGLIMQQWATQRTDAHAPTRHARPRLHPPTHALAPCARVTTPSTKCKFFFLFFPLFLCLTRSPYAHRSVHMPAHPHHAPSPLLSLCGTTQDSAPVPPFSHPTCTPPAPRDSDTTRSPIHERPHPPADTPGDGAPDATTTGQRQHPRRDHNGTAAAMAPPT